MLENENGQFPVNGMARYEAIKAKMEPLPLQVDSLHKKIETVQSEMESIQIDEEFLQKRKLRRRTSHAGVLRKCTPRNA